jgi:uncharacterized Zn-finger protein
MIPASCDNRTKNEHRTTRNHCREQHACRCDGSGGALGHPKVYLEMGDQNFVECGYCDRRFVLSPEAIAAREKGEAVAH